MAALAATRLFLEQVAAMSSTAAAPAPTSAAAAATAASLPAAASGSGSPLDLGVPIPHVQLNNNSATAADDANEAQDDADAADGAWENANGSSRADKRKLKKKRKQVSLDTVRAHSSRLLQFRAVVLLLTANCVCFFPSASDGTRHAGGYRR